MQLTPTTRAAALKYLTHPATLAVILALLACAMYGSFLRNPIIFDDNNFFDGGSREHYLRTFFSLDFRWLPYASFEWTRVLLGRDILWYRAGNLALHAGAVMLLFAFLRQLFMAVQPAPEADASGLRALSPQWLAFFGALLFALHPASVFAAGYLIQRSILMATLLTLAMWGAFLHGVLRRNWWWLGASAVFYLLAMVSKEHSMAAPAVAVAMLLALPRSRAELARQTWPIFVVYGALAIYMLVRLKTGHIIGEAYEPRGADMLSRLARSDLGFDPALAYPLSVLTQCTLFFKYLLIWLLPNPAWMAIDMFEPFANRLWSWPYMLGALGFVVYGAVALRLLWKGGERALLGFGLLCPWLMFATELSTIRIQESFVIYRSYLWMPGLFACLPFVFRRTPEKRTAALLALLVLALLPLTWNRLVIFGSPLQTWNDAARLIVGKEKRPGVERVYHNRGLQLLKAGYPELAIKDFDKALALVPRYPLVLNDRGAAYLTLGNYSQAVTDFSSAIALDPQHSRSYLGRALAYDGMSKPEAALQDYFKLCMFGYAEGCKKFGAGSTTMFPK